MGSSLYTLRGSAIQMADMSANVTADMSPQDITNGGFIPTIEFNRYINFGYQRLYGLLTSVKERYFQTSYDIPLVKDDDLYALPTDFLNLVGIDLYPASDPTMVFPLYEENWGRRGSNKFGGDNTNGGYKWMLINNDIKILPAAVSSDDIIRIHYIPQCVALVADTDAVITPPMFDEFICTYAAIIALDKEETECTSLKQRLMSLEKFVLDIADARNDVGCYPINDDSDSYFGQI